MKMTVEEIITEMTMSYSHAMHLVVEGETDQKLFCSVVGNNKVNIVCASGSDNVIEIIESIDAEKAAKTIDILALGIIDRDYRIPLGAMPASVNIISTDLRDIECMMVSSPVLGHVLNELGSLNKIEKAGGVVAIRKSISDSCKSVACLRYHSAQTNMNIDFKKLDYETFVSKKDLTVDEIKMLGHISGAQCAGTAKICSKVLAAAKKNCNSGAMVSGKKYFTNDFLLLRGHDLMETLAIGLRSLWGSRKALDSTACIVEGHFRVAYVAEFKSTNLFSGIVAWIASVGLQKEVSLT